MWTGWISIRECADYDQISDYALEAMEWCLDIGLLNGYGDGTLAPAAPATRGAVAKMTACLLTWIEQQ